MGLQGGDGSGRTSGSRQGREGVSVRPSARVETKLLGESPGSYNIGQRAQAGKEGQS